MLATCAPGYTKTKTGHKWCVRYGIKAFPSLPTGEHGAADPEIEMGHVKKMIRHLGIRPSCTALQIPALKHWAEGEEVRFNAKLARP